MSVKTAQCLLGLFILAAQLPHPLAHAWSEGGHSIITILAYQQLSPHKRQAFDELVRLHPNFQKDFNPPEDLLPPVERSKWIVGRVGYWPDVAREYDEYNRPLWHYQLGAAMTMGNVSDVSIPEDPGPLPTEATMDTAELYVLQALELNCKVLKDKDAEPVKRALALCWISHLVADLHLPCHSGSLYAESVFTDADGDRGANRITVGQQRLHGVWDQLLGNLYDKADVNRRIVEMTQDRDLIKYRDDATNNMDFHVWLKESRDIAVQYCYVAEVQQAVRVAIERKQRFLPPITLTVEYGQRAGQIARIRAMQASARVAKLLEESL